MNRWFGFLALLALCPARQRHRTRRPRPGRTVPDLHRRRARPRSPVPAPAVTLSLQEALKQARANSPTYRQTLNDAGPAKWGVRNAYGSLLPSVSVGVGPGLHRLGAVQLRRRLRPAHLGLPHLGLQPEPAVAAGRPHAHARRPSRRRSSGPPTRTSAAPASTLAVRDRRPSTSRPCRPPRRWPWPGSR